MVVVRALIRAFTVVNMLCVGLWRSVKVSASPGLPLIVTVAP